MIIEQFVNVIVAVNTKNHYLSKGYNLDFPHMLQGEKQKYPVWFLLVHVEDLPKNSQTRVTRVCDKCGKIDDVSWSKSHQHDLCYVCGHQERVTNYQHCQKCGKDLGHWNHDVKLCRECWQKYNNGVNHPSYGKTKEDYDLNRPNTYKYKIKQWRKSVKNRDDNTCIVCGSQDRIVAHHLYDKRNFPDKIFDIDNGVTLCNKCHLSFHNKYGRHGGIVTPVEFAMFLKEMNIYG